MSDFESVSIDTSKDVVQPTLEELAAKMDEANPPPAEERPEWLPEKFKSAEDLAKAYSELEKKLGSNQPPAATEKPVEANPAKQDTKDANPEEAARKATETAGLNFDELSSQYWENGELPADAYEKLEKSGIPKGVVDQFIAGQQALLDATRQTVFNTVGGEDVYSSMTDWAANTLNTSEINAFNDAVNSGNREQALMAVKGLKARYEASEGFEPKNVMGGRTSAGAEIYESTAQLMKDMNDPKYQKDPAFRRKVEAKLARSDIF